MMSQCTIGLSILKSALLDDSAARSVHWPAKKMKVRTTISFIKCHVQWERGVYRIVPPQIQ